MLTAARLREVLHYDPETGIFTRIANSRRTDLCGQKAGSIYGQGYVHISVDGKKYKAHRLAWLYVTGAWPTRALDHRDQNKANNRFANLREATKGQNMRNVGLRRNNSSGVTGVYFSKAAKKWQAYIVANGVFEYLGIFEAMADAIAARREAERRYHGEFSPQQVAA